MTQPAIAWGLVLTALLLAAAVSGREDKPAGAREDLLALVKALDARKDIAEQAAAVAGERELVEVMRVLGGKDKAGIDRQIQRLSRHRLDALRVKAERDDIVRLARVSLAAAEVIAHYAPARPTPGLGARQWRSYAADLKKAARGLEAAAGTGDGARVKAAAIRVNNACNNCHADFDKAETVRLPPVAPSPAKDILALADTIGEGKGEDVTDQAGRVRKTQRELYDVMALFKPKAKGGVGYDKAGTGIEEKITLLAESELTAAALEKEKDDLVRMANVTLAVAEVTAHFAPGRPQQARQTTRWKRRVAVLKVVAKELKAAAEARDTGEVRKAAEGLGEACKNCHTVYR